MADAKTIHCSLITPDHPVFACDATSVTLHAHDGAIGFLRNRAPMLCKLGVGALTVASTDETRHYFLDGGFAQMRDNELTILTERAEVAGDIDPAGAESELAQAMAMGGADPASRAAKDAALTRARARKRVAASSGR